ncbi:efflux RND transporter periplasmic adaptor subunit [Oleispirillum naphthae]|uniref:efflux RND transporter periplasmic adaptor subunit n=1 Tax=Oleispirillum naphthae TaxID=2838853 RepID=UPI0030823C2D
MHIKASYLAAAAIVAVCVVWVGSGLIGGHASPPQKQDSAARLVRVGVRDSTAQPVTARIVLTGTSKSNRSVAVRAETKGRVAAVLAARGDRLAAGAPIVRLAMDDRAARLKQAESLLAQREIEYAAASKLSDKAFASRIQLATAKAARDDAAAGAAAARLDIARTEIRAPFAGVLDSRPVEVGDYLAVEGLVGALVELDPLKVSLQVTESAIAKVKSGAVAELTLPGGARRDGIVTYVGAVAAAATRTFTVEVEFANPDGAFSEGMTVEAALPLGQAMAHLVSPAVLSLSADGRVGVKTVGAKGTVEFHPAELVREDDRGLWIGGLPQTVRLITVGQDFVGEGQSVEAHPDTLLAAPAAAAS